MFKTFKLHLLVILCAGPISTAQAQSEQWYLHTSDGHLLYVHETGKASATGDTVIVLHGGWGAEHSYLLDPVGRQGTNYRCVFYDQRGSLRSPVPDSTITLDRMVQDLEELRRSLRLDQLTLVAHSMGTALSYAYLARHPARVRGLVLIGAVHPAPFSMGPNMAFVREVWPQADSVEMVERTNAFIEDINQRTVATMRAEGLVPDTLMHVPPQELNLLGVLKDRAWTQAWRISFTTVNTCNNKNWRSMQGGMAFYSQKAANALLSDPQYEERVKEFWPALQAFKGPVHVIMGTCDYVDLGPALWPHVVPRLPDAQLEIVDDAGHSIWMDKPDEFQKALERALEGTTGGQR